MPVGTWHTGLSWSGDLGVMCANGALWAEPGSVWFPDLW